MSQKLVRMLRGNSVGIEYRLRKVSKVVRHDDSRLTTDRRGEYVSIIRIRQDQIADKPLVSSHKAIRHRPVHKFPRATQLLRCQVRALLKKRPDPLGVNFLGPTRTKKVRQSNAQQQIPEGGRIDYAGIVDRCKTRHALVSQPQFLSLHSEFIEGYLAFYARALLILDQVLKKNASVRAYLAIGQFVTFQQSHQMRT